MSDLEELIYHIKNGNNVSAEAEFDGIMSNKMQAALDNRKIEVASSMFNKSAEQDTDEE